MVWLKLVAAIILAILGGFALPVAPQPKDNGGEVDKPKPRKPLIPWRRPPFAGSVQIAAQGGPVSPDGTEEVSCDLPARLRIRNQGGTDGAGLCVWASANHTARWQHVWPMIDVFAYMKKQTGGGWPQRMDSVIANLSKGQELPKYFQAESKDNLPLLKLACSTGRMPCVTYSYSPTGRYGGGYIAHMVSLVHASDHWFCVLDNNFPENFEWMDPTTFQAVHTKRGRQNGWAVVFLADPPPAPPKN